MQKVLFILCENIKILVDYHMKLFVIVLIGQEVLCSIVIYFQFISGKILFDCYIYIIIVIKFYIN